MIITSGVLLIVIAYLLFYIFYMKKQLKNITNQLTDINENKQDKKITVELMNKEVETLAKTINETLDVKKESEAGKIRIEKHLRETIANMSHDLRTPLTSIIGYIQFLKLDNINEDEKIEYLNIAEQRAKSLESLLNDFYELSLIDSLDFELNLEKVNISRIAQEILVEKYIDFNNRNLEPKIEMPSENIYIAADRKSLERVIENLLSNTIKYAKDNVKISLKVEGNWVIFKISNNTANLTAQDVENIFERFYMADKTRQGKGTGVGLAIAKGLVEKMNGNISADISDDMLNIYFKFKVIRG